MRATALIRAPVLSIAAVVAPLVLAVWVAHRTGSLAMPHNDDWSYLKSARHLAATGHLQIQGWGAASLVGQLVLFVPVFDLPGAGLAAANTAMAVVAGIGLLAAQAFIAGCRVRHARHSPPWSRRSFRASSC